MLVYVRRGQLMMGMNVLSRKIGIFACVALIAGVAGCGGIKPKRSPDGTFDSLRKAVVEEDYEGLWGLLSSSARQTESAEIGAEQLRVDADLPNYSEAQKEQFRVSNGISAETFVNLSPAGGFAMRLRNDLRLRSLKRLLESAKMKGVSVKGDIAMVEVEISGETELVKLPLEKHSGLWRIPDMDSLLKAFDIAGRARKAGDIPADTHRAVLACIKEGAFEDLWELFSTDGKKWLAGMLSEDQKAVAGFSEEKARSFKRDSGLAADKFVAMSPKEAFVAELKLGIGRITQIVRILAGDFVKADIVGDRATVTLRSLRGPLPLERENGRWYFARME
jgi:hypothetical protein